MQLEGVLIAADAKGIIRSTDDGKHWRLAISEGGAGIAVERIKGGFAAITYNTTTQCNKIRISLDKRKTWRAIDNDLSPSISSIKQMGKYLICGDMGGLFRSSDMGKTWSRVRFAIIAPNAFQFYQQYIIRPPVDSNNVLRLYVAGDTLYAVAEPAGC
ncbi:WD40/YVTN/BNR-like repeat-containing protein [Mucilaginibacter sp. HD30]